MSEEHKQEDPIPNDPAVGTTGEEGTEEEVRFVLRVVCDLFSLFRFHFESAPQARRRLGSPFRTTESTRCLEGPA